MIKLLCRGNDDTADLADVGLTQGQVLERSLRVAGTDAKTEGPCVGEGQLADGDPPFRLSKSYDNKGAHNRGLVRVNVDNLTGKVAGGELIIGDKKGVRP